MTDERMTLAPTTFRPAPPMPVGLTPYLTIRGGRGLEAMAFYEKAFGAKEVFRTLAEDGKRVLHCRFEVNGAMVFFSDDFPDFRGGAETPAPAAVMLHLQVDDAEAWANRATAAGAKITMPFHDAFWGDHYGHITDPYGHTWSIGGPKKG
jgi:PhnB protein